jgi:hypothetical protein
LTKYLFLDDRRQPREAFEHTLHHLFLEKDWIVVKSYVEFTDWICENGLPDYISFDHDLAPSHYTPQHLWDDYEASKAWQEAQVHEEETGEECAKWLREYCKVRFFKLPEIYCHSMNPVGKDKILAVFND